MGMDGGIGAAGLNGDDDRAARVGSRLPPEEWKKSMVLWMDFGCEVWWWW